MWTVDASAYVSAALFVAAFFQLVLLTAADALRVTQLPTFVEVGVEVAAAVCLMEQEVGHGVVAGAAVKLSRPSVEA